MGGDNLTRRERMLQLNAERHKTNTYDLSGEYGIGYTLNTNEEFYFDLEDYDLIKDYGWYKHTLKRKSGTEYYALEARILGKNKHIRMHQLLGCKGYDHIDRNTLNNRRSNLRPCSRSQNAMNTSVWINNTSGTKGVYYNKSNKKWFALIVVNYERKFLGYFHDKQDAIKARREAEKKYFGEFAT